MEKKTAHAALFLVVLCAAASELPAEKPPAEKPSGEKPLAEWSFARDWAGWGPNGEILEPRWEGGAVRFRAAGSDPIIDGPAFGPIRASNGQAIEIVLRRSSGGRAQIFFTNTEEGPYRGFRETWSVHTDLPRSDAAVRVIVRPFWEALGTVSRLRLDPPSGEFVLEAVRILPGRSPEAGEVGLEGAEPLCGIVELKVAPGEGGLFGVRAAASDWGAAFVLPAGGIDAAKNPFLEIEYRPGSVPVSSILWASSEQVGLQEGGRTRTVADAGGREAIDLSGHPGWKGKISLLGIRFGERPGDRLDLSGIRLSPARSGPAHLALLFLGPRKAVSRAGRALEIEAHLENQGGRAFPGGAASLRPLDGTALEIPGSSRRVPEIEPGGVARISFSARARRPGRASLVLEAGGRDLRGEVRIDPPLLSRRLEEGKEPPVVPAATSRQIGIYYFPGWSPDQWTRWKLQVPFPERMPELGFYREGAPEVMDWHIRWALENGISFFIFDWYWRDGKIVLERGLHEGFLEARHGPLLKFSLLWANHDPFAAHTREQLVEVTGYWIEKYFRRPNYLLVDGKPSVFFFAPGNLTRDLKSSDAVREAFEAMRARARAAGFPGLWIAACGPCDPGWKERFAREGYDAVTAYNYPTAGNRGALRSPFRTLLEGHEPIWRSGEGAQPIPYIPLLAVGWDSRPWHGPAAVARLGRTAEDFEAGLRALAAHMDRTGAPLAILEAWNELGEGSDIEPTAANGFGLLEAVRKVFGKGPFPENIVPADLGLSLPSIDPDLIAGWDPAAIGRPVESRGKVPQVIEGLSLRCEGDTATLLPGKLRHGRGVVELRSPASFRIEPAPVRGEAGKPGDSAVPARIDVIGLGADGAARLIRGDPRAPGLLPPVPERDLVPLFEIRMPPGGVLIEPSLVRPAVPAAGTPSQGEEDAH